MNQLPEKQFDVTFVRTQFATATVLATTLEEAIQIAAHMANAGLDETEAHTFPEYLQPEWKVDDVAPIRTCNWTVTS
jgi:hypothetical protein